MRINAIDTIEMPADTALPGLLFVRIHTDEGLVGIGDTYYLPGACREVIVSDIAPTLLGDDPLDIERHASRVLGSYFRFGGRGAEIRAWSAVELALWDILGKASGQPLYRLLGGAAQPSVRIYNSCGGAAYARHIKGARPGHGSATAAGRYPDYHDVLHRPGELARELLDGGTTGMKIWSFDDAGRRTGPHHISARDLDDAIRPIARIRDSVGDEMDVMVDFHGMWNVDTATRIARALEPYQIRWAEDLINVEVPAAMRRLRESTSIPILASEYLITSFQFQHLLEAEATDVVMIDPTWAGGIGESRRAIALADAHGLPVTFHDCSGPLNLHAGVHLAVSSRNAIYQETLRAWNHELYPDLITDLPVIERGTIRPNDRPGLGTDLQPDLDHRDGFRVTTVTA